MPLDSSCLYRLCYLHRIYPRANDHIRYIICRRYTRSFVICSRIWVWTYGMIPILHDFSYASTDAPQQIFSPLQEVPAVGRRPVYIATLFIFVVLQVPTALAPNIGSLLVLRFLAGFFCSPVLATYVHIFPNNSHSKCTNYRSQWWSVCRRYVSGSCKQPY